MILDALTDTNIHIDVYRGYPPALAWLAANANMILGLPSFVRMELIDGTNNKLEQIKITHFLSNYPIVFPTDADAQWAMFQFETYHLSHGIGIVDCFLAATAIRLQVPLLTRNIKHFLPFVGLTAVAPFK